MTAPTNQPTPPRRGLFLHMVGGTRPTRDELVVVARAGMRGLRLSGFLELGAHVPVATARHLDFLREAAGVGLRVLWRGTLDTIPVEPFRHLYPPSGEDGAKPWPIPRRPMFTLRRGPGFVLVDDFRNGSLVRSYVDDPDEVRLLVDRTRSCVAHDELSPAEDAAVRKLAERAMFTPIGPMWLALPVRFRYARS